MDIHAQRDAIWERINWDFYCPGGYEVEDVVELVLIPSPGDPGIYIGSHDEFWERRGIEVQPGDWSANDHEGSAALYRFEGERIICVASVGD